MSKLKIITLIPARGGSKGIPKKNIVDLSGKPLIYYSIDASLNSRVDETWVSTDDDEIAEIASKFGSKVTKRPKYLARDTTSSEAVLLDFSKKYKDFDILVFLQATCPFIKKEDINKAINLMKKNDSVISVSKLDQFLWREAKPMYDINNRKRRQKRKKTYLETGSIFVTTRLGLIKSKNRISGKIGFVEVPKSRSLDIDTYEDLYLARKLMYFKNNQIL